MRAPATVHKPHFAVAFLHSLSLFSSLLSQIYFSKMAEQHTVLDDRAGNWNFFLFIDF